MFQITLFTEEERNRLIRKYGMLCEKWDLDLKDYDYYNYSRYVCLDKSEKAINEYGNYFNKFKKQFGWNRDKIVMHLGSYAADDLWEMLPEYFNNYYRLKEKVHLDEIEQETYEFVKSVVEDYKKYIPEKNRRLLWSSLF